MSLGALALVAGLMAGDFHSWHHGPHPWHRSQAEVDLRDDPPRIEVALRVDAFDFEQHLRDLIGPSVSLDRPAEIADEVARYIGKRFLVHSAGGHWSEIAYVGLEADLVDCWIYFEAPLPQAPGPLHLSNQVLLERNVFQENLLFVRGEDFATVLTCSRRFPWQTLDGVTLPAPPRPPVGWSVRLPPTPGTTPPPRPPRSVAELGPSGHLGA